MSWLKKNLYLVIGGVVALGLLGLGGYFLYAKIDQENQVTESLKNQTEQMETVSKKEPQPGNAKVNNIEMAKSQDQELQTFLDKARKTFLSVPSPANLDSGQFKILLETTVDRLRRAAGSAGVKLPNDYVFTFAAEKPLMTVEAGSVQPLTQSLLTIQEVCQVLFSARVLALDGIRRIAITAQDTPSPTPGQSDYWNRKPETNDLAVITPYEFTFHCFTTELASVMHGLATNRYCFIVRNMMVDTGTSTVLDTNATATGEAPVVPSAAMQQYQMMMRYGGRYGRMPQMAMPPPEALTPGGSAPIKRNGMTVVLNEKPFRVVLRVDAVRMIEGSEGKAGAKPAKPARPARAAAAAAAVPGPAATVGGTSK